MKKLFIILVALTATITMAQNPKFLRNKAEDQNVEVCINDATVEKCPLVVDGALSSSRIGGATSTNLFSGEPPHLQIDNGSNTQGMSITRSTDNQFAGSLFMGKSRGSNGSPGAVVDNDFLGTISWQAHDGTDFFGISAQIRAEIDGTTGTGDVPGALIFSTTADGADTPTERIRILPSGQVNFANSIRATAGAASDPSYGFSADTGNDTGVYRSSEDRVSIAGGGTEVARFRDGGIQAQDGTAGQPGYSFLGESSTGMFRAGANNLQFVRQGNVALYLDASGTGLIARSSPTGGTTLCHAAIGTLSDIRACSSTKRHKDNIEAITEEEALKFYKMRGVKFDWKGNGDTDYGMIAEEAIPHFPELVDYDSDGEVVSFNYQHYTGILTKVIQMQKKEIDLMKTWVCSQADAPQQLCGD